MLVKKLLWRNFCEKIVGEIFSNYHTVLCKQGKFPWKFTIFAISLLEGLIVDLTKKYFGKCLKSYPWKETFLRYVLHLLLNQKNFSLLSAFENVTFIKKGTLFLAYNCSFIFDFHIAKKVFFKVSMHNFCHCLVDSQKKTIKYLKIACLSDFTKKIAENCFTRTHRPHRWSQTQRF